MITIKEHADTNLVETIGKGSMESEDYDRLMPVLERHIQDYKNVRWLFDMSDLESVSIGTIWRDLKFEISHANDFEKVAFVGDHGWQKWAKLAIKPFTKAEIEFFEPDQIEQAREWINERVPVANRG
jgi:hypothetical protein